jgi:hypothetical protein
MRGRKPVGPEVVEQLAGSQQARQRLRAVLETLAGTLRVQDACQRLDIGEARFHELRLAVLEGALAALEPRPAGRPPRGTATDTAGQVEALAQRVQTLEGELKTALLREEIALILPGQLGNREAEQKKTRPRRRKRS